MAGHGLVRQQHELFNHAVRDVALGPHYPADLPFVVKKELGFGQIEIYRAALAAALDQDACQLVHLGQHRLDVAVAGRKLAFRVCEYVVYSRVGHALAAVND